ncbi:hypothetical protein VSU19_21590 [Verrucomicrobiales bacterium BCK34]|nr:hypothetical protein [Verrucomicrobiales bacterium BCK34]
MKFLKYRSKVTFAISVILSMLILLGAGLIYRQCGNANICATNIGREVEEKVLPAAQTERKFSLAQERLESLSAVTSNFDPESFRPIPLTGYQHEDIEVEFCAEKMATRLRFVDSGWNVLEVPSVILKLISLPGGRALVVTKSIFAGTIYFGELTRTVGYRQLHKVETGDNRQFLFREAVMHENDLCVVFFDNVEGGNFLHRYSLSGSAIVASPGRLRLPSVDDPAGKTYEMIPRMILESEADGLFVFSGRVATKIGRDGAIRAFELAEDCWRILEVVRLSNGDWSALCSIDADSELGGYRIVNLTSGAFLEKEFQAGVPWGLNLNHKGELTWRSANSVEQLRAMFVRDFTAAKSSGLLNLGSSNIEGRVAWSQIYYLNGLLDIVYLANRDDRIYDLFYPLYGEIIERLDLEFYLLDRLLESEWGYATRAFTVGREAGLFAVQTSRLASLFHRYRNEVNDSVFLQNESSFVSSMMVLQDHFEEISEQADKVDEWAMVGEAHLKWPKGNAFYFDGLNVPYNHQNEWAKAVFEAQLNGYAVPEVNLRTARDVISMFIRNNSSDGELPLSGDWPYWWGQAWKGWGINEGISVNKPVYPGDHILAWISFKTIDCSSVLTAHLAGEVAVESRFLDSISRCVEQGKVYPFLLRLLSESGRFPSLHDAASRAYVRINSPWEVSNFAWACLNLELEE